jgi:hypothetical protein
MKKQKKDIKETLYKQYFINHRHNDNIYKDFTFNDLTYSVNKRDIAYMFY